jgi:hypothetical protein
VLSSKYAEVLALVRRGRGILEAEAEVLGCNHADVAAYLLGSWGLPEAVVEGVAWHHDPAGSSQKGFSPVIAAHAANCFHEELAPFWMCDHTPLNVDFLEKSGLAGRQESWKKLILALSASANPEEPETPVKPGGPPADNRSSGMPSAVHARDN